MPNIYLLSLEWDKLRDLLALRSLSAHDQDDPLSVEIARVEVAERLAEAGIVPVCCQPELEQAA